MKALRAVGFIYVENLRWIPLPANTMMLCGQIACHGDVVITPSEEFPGRSCPTARYRTTQYNYNASVRGHATFLRYDNSHPHRSHAGPEHRHRMDWKKQDKELGRSP